MRTYIILTWILYSTAAGIVAAQTPYKIPFGSSKNAIELTVSNESAQSVSSLTVSGSSIPTWVKMTPDRQQVSALHSKNEQLARFSFSVSKFAPVKKPEKITLAVTTPKGDKWTKDITIIIEAPDRFALFQNFPNPFNPATRIAYQLKEDGLVRIDIFNVLGQEIAEPIDELQSAGYHEKEWNAGNLSSAVYFYRLSVTDMSGKNLFHEIKKMMLVR
jgi:hypothetical protein